MEEIKILVDMVAKLLQLALWVLVAFFCYKVICIGTLYGVIRLAIVKTHNWLMTPEKRITQFEDRIKTDVICCENSLLLEIHRLKGICDKQNGSSFPSEYIKEQDVLWLHDAIDEKLARDKSK